jgi:hypothetical protein
MVGVTVFRVSSRIASAELIITADHSAAPTSVQQLPATQVKKRKTVTRETTEALDRQVNSPQAPSPITPHKALGIADASRSARSVALQAAKPPTTQKSSSPRQAALTKPKLAKHGVKPNSNLPPAKSSKPAEVATVADGPKVIPLERTPRQLRPAAKLSEPAIHGVIKQPRDFTPPSTLNDEVQLDRPAQTKAKPAVLSMRKPHDSDDDSEVDREISRGMLQVSVKQSYITDSA